MNPGGPNYPTASLYVGDLHPEVTEAMLFEKFSTAGPIVSIRVCRDIASRRSLEFAYVNFQQPADAERALNTMKFDVLQGRPIRIMWSQRDPTLRRSGLGNVFIKNLDKSIDNKAMYDIFSAFGNILSCKVAPDENGECRGYGFVHFETEEAAQKAIQRVNKMLLNDRQVCVGKFIPRRERSSETGDHARRFTDVYIKNFPVEMAKQDLSQLCETFGEILSLKIMTDPEGNSRGFGFVSFESHEAAQACVEELNKEELNGRQLFAGRAQKKSERSAELRARFEAIRQERDRRNKLYIKNLDGDIDDERLRKELPRFGNVTSARVTHVAQLQGMNRPAVLPVGAAADNTEQTQWQAGEDASSSQSSSSMIVDDAVIATLSKKIPAQWKEVARNLSIPSEKIEEIEMNYHGYIVEAALHMLFYWKQKRGSHATYTSLAEALYKADRIDMQEEIMRQRDSRIPSQFFRGIRTVQGSASASLFRLEEGAGILPAMNNVKPAVWPSNKPRRIIIIRHAEGIDATFGEQWLQYCFDKGVYHRRDLNMPREVPNRPGGEKEFKKDSPITEIGRTQCQLTGDGMAEAGLNITQVYSSPALRCVQTADAIISGMKAPDSIKIRVDPCIFEWLACCEGLQPKWLTMAEMAAFGLRVDQSYVEFLETSRLYINETSDTYFKRCSLLGKHILEKCPDDGDILIVGHASSLDGLSRPLQGHSSRPTKEFCELIQLVPYCGCVALQEYKSFGIWELIDPPFPKLTHLPNSPFDWRSMQT